MSLLWFVEVKIYKTAGYLIPNNLKNILCHFLSLLGTMESKKTDIKWTGRVDNDDE